MRKFVAFTGYACNNRCGFCVHLNRRTLPPRTLREVAVALAAARRGGADYVEFVGGEVSIRRDFLDLLALARGLGFSRVAVATNGRLFARPGFARNAVEAGLTDAMVSLHGDTEELHDGLVDSPGAFKALLAGVAALQEAGVGRLSANTAVVRPNVPALASIARLLLSFGLRQAEFIFVDPTVGGAADDMDRWVPRLSEAAPAMRAALAAGRDAGTSEWCVRYVPLCLFRDWLGQVSELREARAFSGVAHWAPDFENPDVAGSRRESARVRPARCAGCRLEPQCEGLWKPYAERYGGAELEPVYG
ncbi:radical SAM protein [bacterium]|nr:MAG: radical SAM protein [bacterium]